MLDQTYLLHNTSEMIEVLNMSNKTMACVKIEGAAKGSLYVGRYRSRICFCAPQTTSIAPLFISCDQDAFGTKLKFTQLISSIEKTQFFLIENIGNLFPKTFRSSIVISGSSIVDVKYFVDRQMYLQTDKDVIFNACAVKLEINRKKPTATHTVKGKQPLKYKVTFSQRKK